MRGGTLRLFPKSPYLFLLQHCLPDCETTRISHRTSSAPLRRCDGLALGSSFLCSMEEDWQRFQPQMWADMAAEVQRSH